ncbi:MAG: electron transport complex subunit RsxD [Gammaproteobacteria bacterium]|nr:MAG: electron transport complex subunit RsxD [Gammaproteobacteria bacterium]
MAFISITSPHSHRANSTAGVMQQLLLATLPGVLALFWFFGSGILIQLALSITTAVLCEAGILYLRKKPIAFYLKDYSAVVTAVLLALAIPPIAPWWIIVIGTGFAMVFAKHLYGGLGSNPFNPAMVGYAFLLISFPLQMTTWLPAEGNFGANTGLENTLQMVFSGNMDSANSDGVSNIDAFSGATPLDELKTQLDLEQSTAILQQPGVFDGLLAGAGWDWVNIGFLIGGIYLIWRKIISWHIPVGFLAGLGILALAFNLYQPADYASPLFHWFSGGCMLGAFFIATDPVSAATSDKGRFIYGFLIGLLIYIIRTFGGYPDAVAFSVLLLNLAAPTIDYYTQPRSYGHDKPNRGTAKKDS